MGISLPVVWSVDLKWNIAIKLEQKVNQLQILPSPYSNYNQFVILLE